MSAQPGLGCWRLAVLLHNFCAGNGATTALTIGGDQSLQPSLQVLQPVMLHTRACDRAYVVYLPNANRPGGGKFGAFRCIAHADRAVAMSGVTTVGP